MDILAAQLLKEGDLVHYSLEPESGKVIELDNHVNKHPDGDKWIYVCCEFPQRIGRWAQAQRRIWVRSDHLRKEYPEISENWVNKILDDNVNTISNYPEWMKRISKGE